ncbi:hypothetical protein RB195_020689 [Necator americanus]|uniref:G-protein coupled receptors family 1 profile domain-containing protein n=1 Tax=Necator americanus TaxID=51031 RepID=A0ABR1CNF5_NECAM
METDRDRLDQIIAGIIILAIALVGGAVNISALMVIYRSPMFHNSFGILCASHIISDIGFLLPHIFWAAPSEIFAWPPSLTISVYGDLIGQLLVFFCSVSTYSQLEIALNRFVAVVAPMSYSTLFSTRRTVSFLALFWVIGLFRCTVYFIGGCEITHDSFSFTWKAGGSDCIEFIELYLEFIIATIICITVIILNTITFIVLYKHTRKLSSVSDVFQKMETNMHRRNLNFFLQSCTQAVLFVIALSIYFFFSKLTTTKWQFFATRTLTWEMAHCMNGLIIFIFNDNFRCNSGYPALLCGRKAIDQLPTFGTKSST